MATLFWRRRLPSSSKATYSSSSGWPQKMTTRGFWFLFILCFSDNWATLTAVMKLALPSKPLEIWLMPTCLGEAHAVKLTDGDVGHSGQDVADFSALRDVQLNSAADGVSRGVEATYLLPAMDMTPRVFSGFCCILTSQMLVAASFWLSHRDGAKSPFLLYSELSKLQ